MSSRKEQKEALRAERERREAEAAAGERRKRMMGLGVAGVLAVAAIAAVAVAVLASGGGKSGGSGKSATPQGEKFVNAPIPPARGSNLEAAAKAAKCKLAQHPSEGRSHVSGHVDYKTNPPSSGNHFEVPAQDGPYAPGSAPSAEALVHSLEHGRVIFWYQPSASPQLKGQLKSLYDEDTYHVILAPNPRKMTDQVAASSWTRTLNCPTVTDKTWDALRLFRDRYRDQAPESVP
jgi:hypothetical protein